MQGHRCGEPPGPLPRKLTSASPLPLLGNEPSGTPAQGAFPAKKKALPVHSGGRGKQHRGPPGTAAQAFAAGWPGMARRGKPATGLPVSPSPCISPFASYGMTLSESVSSPVKPLAEPSQYMAQVQVVVLPSEPGVQVTRSEPSPLTPVTPKLPSVVR